MGTRITYEGTGLVKDQFLIHIQWKEVKNTMRENWIYRRGDIYYANLGSRKGSEQGGKRPVIVIQNNTGNKHAPTLTVVPVTSALKKTNQPTHFVFNPKSVLKRPSMVMAEQTQTIDKSRIVSYVGRLDEAQMLGVDRAVRVHFGFDSPFKKA